MIPSKREDFTGPHGGFEGEEKRGFYLRPGESVQVQNDGGRLFASNSTPPRWRLVGSFNPPHGIMIYPLPLPDGNAE